MDARDRGLLADLVEHAEEAIRYVDGVTAAEFRKDRKLHLVIERLLEIVGEAAGSLSEEARAKIPFDWKAVRGLRNVIAHQYGAVDPDAIHAVVRKRLPGLVRAIRDAED